MSNRSAAIMLAAGAALISLTGILVRYADVPATVSAFWRMLFGGTILALALLPGGFWRQVRRRDWLWMALPAAGMAADLALWHRSIHSIGPGLATLLTNFQVFFMALAGLLLYRERLGPRFLLGALLAFIGTWFLVGAGWGAFDPAYRNGVWLGLLSGVAYTVYLLGFRDAQRRRQPSLDASVWLAINSLLCAALLGALALAEGSPMAIPTTRSLVALLALGLVGQCLGWLLIVRAMPLLPASLVGLLLLLQPALAFVLDVVLFQRATGGLEWLGLGLALGGIFIGSVRLRRGKAHSTTDPQGAAP